MGKLAPMLLGVLISIVCQIDAAFYVEVHDRGDYDFVGVSLFECDVVVELRRYLPTAMTSRTSIPSYLTDQDITCTQVTNRQKKRRIYSTTNFHLVVDPRLPRGKRIILGTSRPVPYNIFLGITIIGTESIDHPALIDNLGMNSFDRLQAKCRELPSRFLPFQVNVESITRFTSLANFRQFANIEQNMIERFQLYAQSVGTVWCAYRNKVVNARQNEVRQADQTAAKLYVKGALNILLSKMIDPCFVESYLQESGQRLTRDGFCITGRSIDIADSMCKHDCLLMSAAFSLYSVPSDNCRGQLTGGQCQNKVCKCEKRSERVIVRCSSRPKFVAMIECNNDLRTGLAESVDFSA